jgi:hypothetical protein
VKNVSIIGAAIAMALITTAANSAEANEYRGFYAGVGAGVSGFELDAPASPRTDDSLRGGVLKLFTGYQFNRFLGLEGGYARLGNFSETRSVGGTDLRQTARANAWYAAATGRLPIGDVFAVTAKVGVARGKVYGDDSVAGVDNLYGHKESLLVGIGGQYRLGEKTDLQLDIEAIDEAARRTSVGTVTMSIRRRF